MDIANSHVEAESSASTLACESLEAMEGEVSNLRRWNAAEGPAGLGTESDCAGEAGSSCG
jgi:hypothetical protein